MKLKPKLVLRCQRLSLMLILLTMAFGYRAAAQVIGNWNFNNVLTGTTGTFNTVSVADFSPAVATKSFNGSIEYYGQDGWPAGGVDPSYYLQFTLTPNTGYALNILSLTLRMRHSSTGPSGGSGPMRFALRSSVDGYTSDITTGTLTSSLVNNVVNPGAAFANLPTATTFRIYGYSKILYAGGNDRFVFDNIQVDAIGIILPLKLISFGASLRNREVLLNYNVEDVAAGSQFIIERSGNGISYTPIHSFVEMIYQRTAAYQFFDHPTNAPGTVLFYRIKIIAPGKSPDYSEVKQVTVSRSQLLQIRNAGQTLVVSGLTEPSATLMMFNAGGAKVGAIRVSGDPTGQPKRLPVPVLPTGIYYLKLVSMDGHALFSNSVHLGN
jgi:hypothetical protein